MSRPRCVKVFRSYASKDDQYLTERPTLRGLSTGLGWTSRGRSLSRVLEEQLQGSDGVIAVMRAEAVVSETCRAQRAVAFHAGTVVRAILGLGAPS